MEETPKKTKAKAKTRSPKSSPKNYKSKKKPGRPRKNPLKKSVKRNGVAVNPVGDNTTVEFVYDIPINFKKIFQLFTAIAARNIRMDFKKDRVDILTCCHLKKSWVKVTIDCSKVNHYYCARETSVFINPGTTEKIIKNLNKEYTTISWILYRATDRSSVTIVFKNALEIDERRTVNLVQDPGIEFNANFSDEGYPLSFFLTGKYFKQLISISKSFSDRITLKKIGEAPLIFEYSGEDGSSHKHIVKNPKNISLDSKVDEDDIFSSTVNIDYIEPLSKILITNNVKVSADCHKNMIFETNLDKKVISIYMSTQIVSLDKAKG